MPVRTIPAEDARHLLTEVFIDYLSWNVRRDYHVLEFKITPGGALEMYTEKKKEATE